MPVDDPFNLERFVDAQAGDYATALAEVRAGRKRTHWMWYIFPQLAGLGSSTMAQRYAIATEAEARAYLAHPVLGPRLMEISEAAVLATGSAREIFGSPDDLKLLSSATLFAAVSAAGSIFHRVLERFFEGRRDDRTIQLLAGQR